MRRYRGSSGNNDTYRQEMDKSEIALIAGVSSFSLSITKSSAISFLASLVVLIPFFGNAIGYVTELINPFTTTSLSGSYTFPLYAFFGCIIAIISRATFSRKLKLIGGVDGVMRIRSSNRTYVTGLSFLMIGFLVLTLTYGAGSVLSIGLPLTDFLLLPGVIISAIGSFRSLKWGLTFINSKSSSSYSALGGVVLIPLVGLIAVLVTAGISYSRYRQLQLPWLA